MNRFALSAQIVQRAPVRYTPAGLPALDLVLAHASEVIEDGQPRQVTMELKAIAIGSVTVAVERLALGTEALCEGFIAATRNGRGLLFHLTACTPDATAVPVEFDSSP